MYVTPKDHLLLPHNDLQLPQLLDFTPSPHSACGLPMDRVLAGHNLPDTRTHHLECQLIVDMLLGLAYGAKVCSG